MTGPWIFHIMVASDGLRASAFVFSVAISERCLCARVTDTFTQFFPILTIHLLDGNGLFFR